MILFYQQKLWVALQIKSDIHDQLKYYIFCFVLLVSGAGLNFIYLFKVTCKALLYIWVRGPISWVENLIFESTYIYYRIMLKVGHHFGIHLLTVLTSINIIQAQLSKGVLDIWNSHLKSIVTFREDEPCKFNNKSVEDTYCNTKCKTYGPADYRCDAQAGLVCCTCSFQNG